MFSANRSRARSTCAIVLVGLILLFSLARGPSTFAQDALPASGLWLMRAFYATNLGLSDLAGLAFSPEANVFFTLEVQGTTQSEEIDSSIVTITLFEELTDFTPMASVMAEPLNMAFDAKTNRLFLFETATNELIAIKSEPAGPLDPAAIIRIEAQAFGLQNPKGLTFDPVSGHLFILDSAGPRLVRIEPDSKQGLDGAASVRDDQVFQVDLKQTGMVDPQGIAFNPDNGHLYLMNLIEQALYELKQTGQVVSTHDLSKFGLGNPQGMVFAPSGDPTDDPGQMSLYIADSSLAARSDQEGDGGKASETERRPGRIIELSLTEPVQMTPATSEDQASLVQTIDTSQFFRPSPDPAGITYLPSTNSLLIVDSEVDETPLFAGVNLFEVTLSGRLVRASSTMPFSRLDISDTRTGSVEPTGSTFNPSNGHLFFTDDNEDKIFDMNPGLDGLYGTSDDIISTFYTTGNFGGFDVEGIAFDSQRGHLFIVDGPPGRLFKITTGANDFFDGPPPVGDDQVTRIDTVRMGVQDPEGIAFNLDSGTLFITGAGADVVVEVTTQGTLVRVIDISFLNALSPAGLTFAPGSINPTETNLYLADRGVDNASDPLENDGKVYEISIPPLTTLPTPTPKNASGRYLLPHVNGYYFPFKCC